MVGINEKIYTLGIIGYGGMAGNHRKQLEKKNVRVRLKGIFDIDQSRREAAIEQGYTAYESLDALLADEEIDIVLVATPNDSHKDLALRVLDAGAGTGILSAAVIEAVCRRGICRRMVLDAYENDPRYLPALADILERIRRRARHDYGGTIVVNVRAEDFFEKIARFIVK